MADAIETAAGERLYEHASIKKKKLEEARMKANQHTPKLVLESKETYEFADEERDDVASSPRYLKLYEDAMHRRLNLAENLEQVKPKVASSSRNERCERLYNLSSAKQMEGKQRRAEIEKARAPPPPTEYKTIPLSHATRMYERSMKHLIVKEMKLMDAAHEREINYESILIPESTINSTI